MDPVTLFLVGSAVGISGLISGYSQKYQDTLSTGREKKRNEDTLLEAQTLFELDKEQSLSMLGLQSRTATAQATRYQGQQNLLADQTIDQANRQMTLLGLQAMSSNRAATQQLMDMQFSRSQNVGTAEQRAAVSGLRSTGSVMNQRTMQDSLASRQIGSLRSQMGTNRTIVEKQLANQQLTASQAAAQLRYAGNEQMTRTEDDITIMTANVNNAIDTGRTRLDILRSKLEQEIDWNDDDLAFLNSGWVHGGIIASSAASTLSVVAPFI